MFKRLTVLACATLLLAVPAGATNAQDPKSDIEAIKAELAKTKRDLEAVKKELAQARADIDRLNLEVLGPPLKLPPKDVQAELLKRWNAVAGDRVTGFAWTEFTSFPHPTFKGGSGEAYGALGKALVTFLQKDDNFEYLAKNGLFTTELVTGGGRPLGKGIRTTFASWARQLSDPKSFAKMDDDTRKALAELSDRIEKSVKKSDPPKK